jgi:hypothetical protein
MQSHPEATPEDLSPFEDHRLNDLDRRRLGARVLAYGSHEVIRRHNAISYMAAWARGFAAEVEREGDQDDGGAT